MGFLTKAWSGIRNAAKSPEKVVGFLVIVGTAVISEIMTENQRKTELQEIVDETVRKVLENKNEA